MNVIKKQDGFSLIEVLAVIAIMGIMAIAIVPRYLSNKQAKSINFAKTSIVDDMRYVQNGTLSGMKLPDDDTVPMGGFGINIKNGDDYFLIFGDKNGSGKYDGGDGILETVALENGVHISKLERCADRSCGSVSDLPSKIDYVCVPPYGKGFINNINTEQEVIIRITLSVSGGMQSSFIISSSGYTSYIS